MAGTRTALTGFLAFFIGLSILCGSAAAAGIRVVPSTQRALPGDNFYFDVVAEGIPAEGLGGAQFRLSVTVPGGAVTGVADLGQAGANEVAVATPLLISQATDSRSGIGDFFRNAAGPNGILVMDNEPLTGGSALYTFAHTSGSIPPSGSGSVARFMVRIGPGVNAKEINIGLTDVMLLDGGPYYSLDYNTGATVQIGCFTRMPDLLGLTLSEATSRLAQSQLLLGNLYEINNTGGARPLNVVLEQSSPAGSELLCEAPVNLAVNVPPVEATGGSAVDKHGDDSGAVVLGWTPVSASDIAGYRIYQGSVLLKDIPNPATTGTEIAGLATGVASLLRLSTYDTYGNESQGVSIPATPLDDVAPFVTISGVTEGAYYRNDVTPLLSITDTNLAGQTVTLNGNPYALAPLTADGTYTLTVIGEDRFTNRTTRSVHFTIDKTPPAITVATVADGGSYNVDVAPVVTVTDTNLKAGSATLNGQPYVSGTPVISEGSYALVVSVEDMAGNTATRTVTFIIDKTAPVSAAALAVPKYESGGVLYVTGQTPLNLSAQDNGIAPSGVAGIDYGLDGVQAMSSYTAPVALAGLPDGNHTVAYRADDRATNRENTHTLAVTLDNTPPVTSLTLSGPNQLLAGGAYGATSATMFNLQATDLLAGVARTEYRIDGGTWTTYAPFAMPEEGTHTIEYRSADNLDNTETMKSRAALIDNTPPVTAITIGTPQYAAAGGGLYIQGSTPFTLAATDNVAGVQRTEYRLDAGDWTTYQGAFTVSAAGAHTVSYRAIDLVGNQEQVKTLTVVVDNSPPLTEIAVGAPKYAGTNLFVRSTTPFTLAATDDFSGVVLTEYRIDDGGWTPYAPFTVQSEGAHVIRYRSSDHVGNREMEKTFTVIVDDTPPVSAISISNPKYQGSSALFATSTTTFTITATDAGSGVERIEYRIDGGAWTLHAPFTLSAEGPHTIDYRASDLVGNLEAFRTLSVTVDNTSPASAITVGAPRFTAADGTLYTSPATTYTLTATDNLSGIASTEYRNDSGAWIAYAPFTIAAEGSHAIGYRSIDNVTNAEVEKTMTVVVDNAPPVTTISVGVPKHETNGKLYVTGSTAFTLSVTDNLSGVARTEYRIDDGQWLPYASFAIATEGEHVIGFRSADNLSNQEAEKILTIIVDNTTPVSTIAVGSPQYSANGNLYISGRTELDISATDSASGVKASEYGIDKAAFSDYAGPFSFAALTDGGHIVVFRSADNLGNLETAKQLDVILDKTPPQTVITASPPLTAEAVNTISPQTIFTLTTTDNLAGVKGIWYRIDDGQWLLYADGFTLAGLKAGSHTISYSACDNVGNDEAERTISVRLILAEVKKEISSEPVVLVGAWQEGADKVKNRSVIDTLTQILSSLGISYHVAENGDDFKQSFRSGRFTIYILMDYKDEKVGAELREAVNHGDSLIFIKTQPTFDAILYETFGVKFTGKTTSDNLLINLLESPLGSEGALQSSGKPVVIGEIQANANTVRVFGQVADKHNLYPAITFNEYGRGKVILYTFDLLASPDKEKVAALLGNSISLLKTDRQNVRALESLPMRITVSSSTEPLGLLVREILPAGTAADTIVPQGAVMDTAIIWLRNLAASSKAEFGYYLNLPDAVGEFSAVTDIMYANHGDYRPYETAQLTAAIQKDSAGLLREVIAALNTLPVTGSDDLVILTDAVSRLSRVTTEPLDGNEAEKGVEAVAAVTRLIRSLSSDTAEIRLQLDELLKILERKWYLTNLQEKNG